MLPRIEFRNIDGLIHAVKFGRWEKNDADGIFYDLMEKGIEDDQIQSVERLGKQYRAVLKDGQRITADIPCIVQA